MRNRKITNKKAFTLIELLAVIVILAIIALIAVPVIMNIINKANKSAFKDTAYGIISAGELYFAEQQLNPLGMQNDVTIQLPDTTKTLELKGEIPTGSITITKEGKISLVVKNNRYCITKGIDDKDITITEDVENCEIPNGGNTGGNDSGESGGNPGTGGNQGTGGNTEKTIADIGTTTATCVTSGTCTQAEINAGIKVNVKVNEEKSYDFYVIADDGEKVTLIMDRNLGTQVAWVNKSDYTNAGGNETDYGDYGNNNLGPITVLNYLNSQINSETETWTNIAPIKSYEYINHENGTTNTYGYQKLNITNGTGVLTSQDGTITTTLTGTMRARLLTYDEASSLKTANSNTTPTWLYENLSSSNTTDAPYGYWFLTADPSNASNGRSMYYHGTHDNQHVYYETGYGVRPVIELSKSL